MNHKRVCRTAPATPGLLNSIHTQWPHFRPVHCSVTDCETPTGTKRMCHSYITSCSEWLSLASLAMKMAVTDLCWSESLSRLGFPLDWRVLYVFADLYLSKYLFYLISYWNLNIYLKEFLQYVTGKHMYLNWHSMRIKLYGVGPVDNRPSIN